MSHRCVHPRLLFGFSPFLFLRLESWLLISAGQWQTLRLRAARTRTSPEYGASIGQQCGVL